MKYLIPFLSLAMIIGCKNDPPATSVEIQGKKITFLSEEEISNDKGNFTDYRTKFPKKARIRRQTAEEKLARYKIQQTLLYERFGIQYDPAKDIYGFTFSTEHIKELLNAIDSINQSVTQAEDSLIGIRVYMGREVKLRTPNDVKFVPDAFLIPVKLDGSNLFAIDDDLNIPKADYPKYLVETEYLDAPDPVFNRSVPCPNQCN